MGGQAQGALKYQASVRAIDFRRPENKGEHRFRLRFIDNHAENFLLGLLTHPAINQGRESPRTAGMIDITGDYTQFLFEFLQYRQGAPFGRMQVISFDVLASFI
ncbi:MAG: hypothetical protein GY815_06410 [Gammaproteobacteria bacterium]|nr:hypothetical protein [Gammaproteobacteria bacterium]